MDGLRYYTCFSAAALPFAPCLNSNNKKRMDGLRYYTCFSAAALPFAPCLACLLKRRAPAVITSANGHLKSFHGIKSRGHDGTAFVADFYIFVFSMSPCAGT
jgi:hypothetical protein